MFMKETHEASICFGVLLLVTKYTPEKINSVANICTIFKESLLVNNAYIDANTGCKYIKILSVVGFNLVKANILNR